MKTSLEVMRAVVRITRRQMIRHQSHLRRLPQREKHQNTCVANLCVLLELWPIRHSSFPQPPIGIHCFNLCHQISPFEPHPNLQSHLYLLVLKPSWSKMSITTLIQTAIPTRNSYPECYPPEHSVISCLLWPWWSKQVPCTTRRHSRA